MSNTVIQVIFSDIDGCFVPQHYDPLGLVQRDGDSEPYFEHYRNYTGPQLVLCTGRAWANTRGILQRAGYLPRQGRTWPDQAVLCEHGMDVITDPVRGSGISLFDAAEGFHRLRPAIAGIQKAGSHLETALDRIRRALENDSGKKIAPILLLRKKYSIAVRLPLFEGTAEQIDPVIVVQRLAQVVQPHLGDMLETGAVQIHTSSSAVDILPPIDKGDGVRFLLDRYGTPPEQTAYIGDSTPDIDGMRQVVWAFCPANATPDVRAYVASLGQHGYISPLAYADAEIDILNRIQGARPGRSAIG
jgi:hydroxymethylpyrimidine pyrophosphatase-like HAD family hydrolase